MCGNSFTFVFGVLTSFNSHRDTGLIIFHENPELLSFFWYMFYICSKLHHTVISYIWLLFVYFSKVVKSSRFTFNFCTTLWVHIGSLTHFKFFFFHYLASEPMYLVYFEYERPSLRSNTSVIPFVKLSKNSLILWTLRNLMD